MKKLFNRPMKVLFCFLTAFSTFMVSAPSVHASTDDGTNRTQSESWEYSPANGSSLYWEEPHGGHGWEDGVEINIEKQFGASNMVHWNGCWFWEDGTYEITNVTVDNYKMILRYYFYVVDDPNIAGTGYSYQVAPVQAFVGGVNAEGKPNNNPPREALVHASDNIPHHTDKGFDWVTPNNETHWGPGIHYWGSVKYEKWLPRGVDIKYELNDGTDPDNYHTATNINAVVNIPLKQYQVNFWNSYTATPIRTETVTRYNDATAPANPSATGYQFTGWDKGFTNITSDLDVYAKWNRLNPEIKARESAYKIGDRVDLWKLQTNSKADDTRQGNITGRVEIISDVVHNGQLDTSTKGIYDVTYKVTNDDDLHLDQPKSAEKHTKIHIIDPNDPLVDINLTDENIYSRYISGNEMMNGQRPVNDLKPYSIWSRTGLPNMWNILNNSLNRRTPLFTIDGVHGQ